MKPFAIVTSLLLSLCLSGTTLADMDVDEADSLDFGAFHKQKEDAVVLFEKEPESTPEKVYQEDTAGNADEGSSSHSDNSKVASKTVNDEQHYEIRERYTLGSSSATPYSALFVIEALHRQMAKLCPGGWTKHGEWTVPVAQDFYLHYEFSCRENSQ